MMIVVSSKYCSKCDKHFELGEMKLGKEQIVGGERLFRACPICGSEIEDTVVEEGKK